MGTQFLRLKDDIVVEIDNPDDDKVEMHAATAERVNTTMDTVGQMVVRVLTPIRDALGGFKEKLNVPVEVSSAEVELGLSFSAEGNIFVAKSKAEGTMKVKVVFKPVAPPEDKGANDKTEGKQP